ncbi:PREDICTED: F-box/kelch-repeat protein At4g19865-like [Camelina sativa]|uniref:F-box/kelch-repeat protein At4g19865-like n=1 Tax=Camelina sativa TaxID=90675 RepID=A0ABM0V613_CAMSA|nr:PREDICTED: F-box/kelch-repeat protein At4g19865-like [Camelina sativa]
MNVARNNAKTCFHDGKIYVTGGRPGVEPFAEAFNIKTQTWEGLPEPVPGIELGNKSFPYIFEDLEERLLSGYRIRERKWDLREISFSYVSQVRMCDDGEYTYGDWKEVEGLRSLGDKYKGNGGSSYSQTKLVSCGGKLLIIWLGCSRKIWGAQIAVEMRDGNEVWGKAEWVDVVYTNPGSWVQLLHCLPGSV